MRSRWIAVALLFGLGGCGGDDGGGLPAGDPLDADAEAARLAAAFCDHRDACRPVLNAYLDETHADCVAENTARLRAIYQAVVPLIDAGRVAYVAARLDACIASYHAATADCSVGVDPAACAEIFVGATPAGGDCSSSAECAGDAFCTAEGMTACGTCQPAAAAGARCETSTCVVGTTCLELNDGTATCVPSDQRLGAACGTVETGLCREPLQCAGAGPFACVLPVTTVGGACDDTGGAADCDVYRGLTCSGGHCAELTLGGAGAACGSATTTLCKADFYCDAGSRCAALPVAGQPCRLSTCAEGSYCDGTTCRATVATGGACTTTTMCGIDEYCVDQTCGPLHYDSACP